MTIGPNFVFIHVPRTAGNTMARLFLSRFGGVSVGKDHERAVPTALREHVPKFTFAVVRNPYDRMLSCWHHVQRNSTNKEVAAMDFPEFIKLLDVAENSWDESGDGQAGFLDSARIDRVLRFEKLPEEVLTLPFNTMGAGWPSERLNAEQRPPWRDEIAAHPEWAGVVEWHSARDFGHYGYERWKGTDV